MTPAASLAPHRDSRSALHHRPFVLVDIDDGVAVRRAALPGGAEALLGQLPGALTLRAGLVLRLTRDLAVGRERHLELGARGGGGRERLAVEELGLDFLRGELGGGERDTKRKKDRSGCEQDSHGSLP